MSETTDKTNQPFRFLFALTDGGGTVPPELGVVQRLIDRGHHVDVLAEASMQESVLSTGAELHLWTPAPDVTDTSSADVEPAYLKYQDWEIRSPWTLARGMADHMIAGPAPEQARATMSRIRTSRPDRVVTSFTAFGAMIAASAAEIPFDVLMPNIYPLPAAGKPPMGTGLSPAHNGFGRFRDRFMDAASTRLLGHFTLPRLNAVRSEHGLAPIRRHWDQVNEARRQIVLSSRAFDFPVEFPPSVRHTGPILDDPSWATSTKVTLPPGDLPLVLVALSSTQQGQRETLQNIVTALSELPVRGVVTTGQGVDPASLRASPSVMVVRAAPHDVVLEHAALVITHGGHGTVMKSLVKDIPMLVLPHGRDQPDNAVRLSRRGAGLILSKRASAGDISTAVDRLLSEGHFARAAARLGERIRREIAHTRLVAEFESP